jgi:preprotein translocase subunit SecG
MDLIELLNLYTKIGDAIDGSWKTFVAVNTAIFGWLISKKGRLELLPRVMGTLAYGVFAFAIFMSINTNSKYYDAVAHDLSLEAKAGEFISGGKVQKLLIDLPNKNTWDDLWVWIYAVSVFGVGGFILADILCKPEKEENRHTN